MAEKKLTQKELFTQAIEVATNANRPDLVKFFEERIAVLDKKTANRKPTKAQEATVAFREAIVEALTAAGKGVTIAELKAMVEGLEDATPQKMTGLLNPLVKDGTVTKTIDKKVAFFAIA